MQRHLKNGFLVVIFDANDFKLLYAHDGRVPQIPGSDLFEFSWENTMKDRYISAGQINNSKDWSALYYVDEKEEIATKLVDKISDLKGEVGNVIRDIHQLVQESALEAVGCVLLNARLGGASCPVEPVAEL